MKHSLKSLFPTLVFAGLTVFLIIIGAAAALAAPQDWALEFQDAATPSAERVHAFHHMMLYIIFSIAAFVLILLVWVVLRYNKWSNPVPRQFSHNVAIEVLWTIIPVVILLVIAVPSMQLLYYIDRTKTPDMTLKVTGYQWYWGYEYPDQGGINFMSYMVPNKDIDKSKGQLRMLSTDNPVVLPIDTNIRIWITGADVIHSWAVPSFGIKTDGMPGRLNETWVRITKPGVYYGECSELCGKDHAFMPIEVHAVTKDEFAAWVKQKGGAMPAAPNKNLPPS